MKIRRIIVEDSDIQAIGIICKKVMGAQYQCVTDDMLIIGTESFRFRTSSAQWDMVVLKRIEDKVQVDIVGTAGGTGIFNLSWGTESGFVKQLSKRVKEYCTKHDLNFEDIVADEGVRKY